MAEAAQARRQMARVKRDGGATLLPSSLPSASGGRVGSGGLLYKNPESPNGHHHDGHQQRHGQHQQHDQHPYGSNGSPFRTPMNPQRRGGGGGWGAVGGEEEDDVLSMNSDDLMAEQAEMLAEEAA